jgi:membrane protein required for colicin V production
METYDIIMLAMLGAATVYGALKGLAWQIASLASLVLSYVAAYKFRGVLAAKIDATPPWNVFLAMLILYVATSSLIWLLFNAVATTIERLKFRDFDRQMGALAGFVKGVLLCVILTLFVVTLLGETARQSVVRSKSGAYIARLLHDTDSVMPSEIKAVLAPHIARLNAELDPAAKSRTDAPFGSPSPGEPRVAGGGDSGTAWDKILPRPRPGALDLRRGGSGSNGSGSNGADQDGHGSDVGTPPISPYGRRPF